MMTEIQASKILLDISFGNVWFYRDYHGEAADTLVNAYRKLKSRVAVAENTNDEHVQTIIKLQSQLAKENTRNQELEEIIQKQKKVTADAVNNETRVRELEEELKNKNIDKIELERLETHCHVLESVNKSSQTDFDRCQKDLYDLQEIYTKERDENDALQHDLDNLTKAKKELEAYLNNYDLKFDVMEKELAEKTAQVEELQSIRDDLNWFKAEIRKFYDEVMKDGDA